MTFAGLLLFPLVLPAISADSTRDGQWHLQVLNIRDVHRISQGEGVTVGLIDTGVAANHPDLVGNVTPGADFTGANSKGLIDTDGHGTAMAGLIAGHGHGRDSAEGVLGVAPRAKVLPIRSKTDLVGNSLRLASAVDEAVKRRVDVLSMSLGTGENPELEEAVVRALRADIVIVASTGNRPDVFIGYPAKYPGVLAVGASGRDGNLAPVTVTGKEMMLVAPGVDIISTSQSGKYRIGTGTSDATAIVAGAAALIRSKYPKLSAVEVVHRLTATATDKGAPGRDPEYGYGSLNLVAALTADVPPLESATPQPSSVSATASPIDATTAPERGSAAPLRLGPAFLALGALFGLLFLGGIIALVWWVLRRRH